MIRFSGQIQVILISSPCVEHRQASILRDWAFSQPAVIGRTPGRAGDAFCGQNLRIRGRSNDALFWCVLISPSTI